LVLAELALQIMDPVGFQEATRYSVVLQRPAVAAAEKKQLLEKTADLEVVAAMHTHPVRALHLQLVKVMLVALAEAPEVAAVAAQVVQELLAPVMATAERVYTTALD
jgi:hypothetical protein